MFCVHAYVCLALLYHNRVECTVCTIISIHTSSGARTRFEKTSIERDREFIGAISTMYTKFNFDSNGNICCMRYTFLLCYFLVSFDATLSVRLWQPVNAKIKESTTTSAKTKGEKNSNGVVDMKTFVATSRAVSNTMRLLSHEKIKMMP